MFEKENKVSRNLLGVIGTALILVMGVFLVDPDAIKIAEECVKL